MGAIQNAIWLMDRWGGSVAIGPADKGVVAMELVEHLEDAILRLAQDPK